MAKSRYPMPNNIINRYKYTTMKKKMSLKKNEGVTLIDPPYNEARKANGITAAVMNNDDPRSGVTA